MGAFIDSGDVELDGPPKERRPVRTWREERSWAFHKCRDTGSIIWPLTKAYYGETFVVSQRMTVTTPDVGKWITAEAYTFRKLKDTNK